MSDFAKCHGKGCQAREQCWRFLVPASGYVQVWANFDSTLPNSREKCEHFVPTKQEAE